MKGPCSKIGGRVEQAKKRNYEIVWATVGTSVPMNRKLSQLEEARFALLENIRGYRERVKRRSVFEIVLSVFLFIGTPRTQLPSEPAYTVVCTSIYRT